MNQIQTNAAENSKPYEKFMCYGPQSLTDQELLAVIIRSGTKEKDALAIAGDVLALCNENRGLLGLHHLDVSELMQIPGIGEVKAVKLKCISELSSRMWRQSVVHRVTLTDPAGIAEYYKEEMRHLEVEHCRAVFIDRSGHLLGEYLLTIGTVDMTILPSRELFKEALKVNAAQMILVHNHPSGNPKPSKNDIDTTQRIKEAGKLMGIPLLDHIIIGDQKYTSLRKMGLMDL